MAFTTKSSAGNLTGTTPVTVVAAPASGAQRLIKTITVLNRDTATRIITGKMVVGAASTVIFTVTLDPGEQLISDTVLALSATNESLTLEADALATTTEPAYLASYGEAS